MKNNNLVVGLDLGSNSIGWSIVKEKEGEVEEIIDIGVRIFNKSVEDKVPTPKNVARRDARLTRRIIQRRMRRKLKMRNYLISLNLLPSVLKDNPNPENTLNKIGNPYKLRTKGLDENLSSHELGRVLLHFVARRGFLSSKKQLAGDLIDDPDMIAYLNEIEQSDQGKDKEETAFKKDISELRNSIEKSGYRTLGEYLYQTKDLPYQRNRSHLKVNHIIRTDRQMYKDELELIWQRQKEFHQSLPNNFYSELCKIIFYQRPLKLKDDRVGKCSLEPRNKRAQMARLEVQEFRYLQQINILQYFDKNVDEWIKISKDQKQVLRDYLQENEKIGLKEIKKTLDLKTNVKINLESQVRGNTTACRIKQVIGEDVWQKLSQLDKFNLVEDLLSIKKKSALKTRLKNHWKFSKDETLKLCLLEFESGHSNHSLKAINKLLIYLRQGLIYSDARIKAGYGYESKEIEVLDKLPTPPETSNPIVNKAMHELRRLVNAIVTKYGKPLEIRVEMARDLEMNTKRYKAFTDMQKANEKANQQATEAFQSVTGKQYPTRDDKIKYRLWQDQDHLCAYSGKTIGISELFSSQIEVDHILPYKKSLDDSYMNKVICFASENRYKADKTPIDAFSNQADKWTQICQRIDRWDSKKLKSKVDRFIQKEEDLLKRDFIQNQLNDTRYISKLTLEYLKNIGCKVSTTKGQITAWLRNEWGLNSLISEDSKQEKDRTDHRHHAIDALVIACVNFAIYNQIKYYCESNIKDLNFSMPFKDFRKHAEEYLKHIIVSHDVKRKLSGALHEATGLGMIAQENGKVRPVARVAISQITKEKKLDNIVDKELKNYLKDYVNQHYDGDYKKAFSSDKTVLHKDGKTPIYKVRIYKSKAVDKDKFLDSKFAIKDQKGKAFKFYTYGNNHHLEIFKHPQTGQIKGRFITTALASQRQRGIGMPKQPMIKKDYQDGFEFLMVLYINDMVSVIKPENNTETANRYFYRVQKLETQNNRVVLRDHLASNIDKKEQKIFLSINAASFKKYDFKKHQVSIIGDLLDKLE